MATLSPSLSNRLIENLLNQVDSLQVSSPAAPAYKLGSSVTVGSAFPSVEVDIGFVGLDPKNRKNTTDLVKGRKTLWVTLPGAFTPT